MLRDILSVPALAVRSIVSHRQACARGIPGLRFWTFGRKLSLKLLLRRRLRAAAKYFIVPVNIVRYFEFEFAAACLSEPVGDCLDVSSPRLFSLWAASSQPGARIQVINPDSRDLHETAALAQALALRNLRCEHRSIENLPVPESSLDTVWCLSVMEHFHAPLTEAYALQRLWAGLRPGGRIILSVPVDRAHRDEVRGENVYGLPTADPQDRCFFQRVYDKASLAERILSAVPAEPVLVRWFGEREPGRYQAYEKEWQKRGLSHGVNDPLEIAEHYREYARWEDMPGMGVCGILFRKPLPGEAC